MHAQAPRPCKHRVCFIRPNIECIARDNLLDVGLGFGKVFFRGLLRGRQRALVLARSDGQKLDALTVKTFEDVGELRDHADAADHGEWRGGDFVGTARHHIATRCSYLLHADVEP